ncbi:MAG: nitrous oxide reductase accessory protein NosL [Bacteroidetes bacterium]|nr:nitrous oxide reductase accessory protein NosL [Bacteroidota bacterium]
MKKSLNNGQRIMIAVAGLCLFAAIFLPVWKIDLMAPQYPEGLSMSIYANRLGGDVEIINGLNHYIGMRTLHAKDFPEFTYLPYIFGFFALACIVVAIVARRKLAAGLLSLYALFGVLAMVDFWKWEYEYGHNLSTSAPIQVPGMSYQPPLIGFKQLLNFGAYSIPDLGGWLMALAGLLLAVAVFFAFRKRASNVLPKQSSKKQTLSAAAGLISILIFFSSCQNGPTPIQVGKDNCNFCKMGIADARFGAEVVSKKGKAWKFDDVHCLLGFLKEGSLKAEEIKEVYLTRYDGDHKLMPAEKSFLLHSENLRSPMGGNVAAFENTQSVQAAEQEFGGESISWENLRQ